VIFTDMDERPRQTGPHRKAPCPRTRHRSNMMLNPLNLSHLNRIDESLADAVTLNLEDAVAPARKREALENILHFLSWCPVSPNRIVVRVNPLDQGGAEEIQRLSRSGVDAVRLAKVRTRKEIEQALALLPRSIELDLSIETAEAFRDLARWRGIDRRLRMAHLGILDLLADLNLPQHLLLPGNPMIDHLLSTFVIAARTAGMVPVGFMFQDYRDTATYRVWLERMRRIGFDAAACMGPRQVAIADAVFDMDKYAIDRARHIVEAFEKNSLKNINGFMDDRYGFIDEPIYRDALNILKNMEKTI